jgi:hypothetical protein
MITISDDRCAAIVLHCLYSKPIGERVPNIMALRHLCSPKLDGIDEQRLIDVVAAPDGLRGRGLIDCAVAEGDGQVFAVANVELTSQGRACVEEHSPLFRLRRLRDQVCEHAADELVSGIVGAVLGWLLRGWITR